MEFTISNIDVTERIKSCLVEFQNIKHIIDGIGPFSNPIPYLTRYAIIRGCGTIEYGFKTIISDANSEGQSNQIKNFIDAKFRNSSMNPNLSNIHKTLKGFDEEWDKNFKSELGNLEHKDRIKSSLESLNEARNSFSHGGTPSTSFNDVQNYFEDSVRILESIEKAISA